MELKPNQKLYALSDHHFGHQNIIKYCHRKTEEFNTEELTALEDAGSMILAHNAVVQDGDLVIFGGDVSASSQGRAWLPKIIKKLKGHKILIRGNHDKLSDEDYINIGFGSVHDVLVIGNLCFCHFPEIPSVISFCQSRKLILCCGHTHKPFKDYLDGVQRINLAVDVAGRTPLILDPTQIPDIESHLPF